MEQQFELLQVNKARQVAFLFGGIILGVVLIVAGLAWLPIRGFIGVIIASFAGIGSGMGVGILLMNRCSTKPITLILDQQELSVLDQQSGMKQTVAFASVVSYRVSHYRELWLELLDGRSLRLDCYTNIDKDPTAIGIVPAVEAALQEYRQQHALSKIEREKTFFEKPIAKLIPILATVGMLYAAWLAWHRPVPNYSGLLNAVGSYISLLGIWLAAYKRRH